MSKNIILGSSSHLRKILLESTKLNFTVDPANINEDEFIHLPVDKRVVATAVAKSNVLAARHDQSIIITSDTLTKIRDTQIIEDKKTTIQDLSSGMIVDIYTATAILNSSKNKPAVKLSKTTIRYAATSQNNLKRLKLGDERSIRSGSLGIYLDSPGFGLINYIEGSFSAAFGLDIPFIYSELEKIDYFGN